MLRRSFLKTVAGLASGLGLGRQASGSTRGRVGHAVPWVPTHAPQVPRNCIQVTAGVPLAAGMLVYLGPDGMAYPASQTPLAGVSDSNAARGQTVKIVTRGPARVLAARS